METHQIKHVAFVILGVELNASYELAVVPKLNTNKQLSKEKWSMTNM